MPSSLKTDELEQKAIDPGPDKIIAPGFNYATVTDKIANVVLKPIQTTPQQWWITLFIAFVAMQGLLAGALLAVLQRRRRVGHHHPGGLGLRHRQFRVVDRYRPRRNADLGHSAAAQAGLAHLHQPILRSHDAVRRGASRHVPDPAHGPSLAGLLAASLPQFDVAVAAAAQPAGVGRVRGLHLPDRFADFLVHRPDSRSGHACAIAPRNNGRRSLSECSRMGWRGSAKHWARYQMAYLLLGGLATPLVVSVHTVVSFDFAISLLPGWHTTIFPPYFVAGAIYSGFAMVVTLAIPARKWFHLEDLITMRHLDCMRQADARHRADRRLRLHDGSVHVLVQRQSARNVHVYEPLPPGPYRYLLLDADPVQHHHPAVAVVSAASGRMSRGCSSSPSW